MSCVCPESRSFHMRRLRTDSVLQEKSHQVGQMRLIYHNAQNVIIWLGPGNFRTNRLFAQMSSLNQRVIRRPRPRTIAMWKYEWARRSMPSDEDDISIDFEEALRDLLSQDWFERVWTIQEAAMARSARIACGSNQVHSRTFTMMPALLNVTPTANQQARLDIMPGLGRETSWFSRLQDTKFLTLLQRFRSSKTTIPHDSIYALIGICKEAYDSPKMTPDYTLDPKQVVQNTLHFLVNESDQIEGSHIAYYGAYPKWDIEEFLDALHDLPYFFYTWAQQKYKAGQMFAILSVERAKGNARAFERLVTIPGGLDIAIKKHHVELIDMFLEFGQGIHEAQLPQDRKLWNTLLARCGDRVAAKLLAAHAHSQGLFLSKTGTPYAELMDRKDFGQVLASLLPRYCDAVDIAVDLGRADLLESIFGLNPELIGQEGFGCKALWRAAIKGDQRCLAVLLEHGANVESEPYGISTTPLWAAARRGHSECVELLLSYGANTEAKGSRDAVTPRWIADSKGYAKCVEILLRHRASKKAKVLRDRMMKRVAGLAWVFAGKRDIRA